MPAHKKKKTKKEIEVEEEKLLRTVFVGNLPTAAKKKQIIREFSQFGKVESARLRSVALVDVSSSSWDLLSRTISLPAILNELDYPLVAYLISSVYIFFIWVLHHFVPGCNILSYLNAISRQSSHERLQ